MVIRDELYEIGIRQRRAMFGAEGAEGRVDTTTDLNDKLEDFVTRTTFGPFRRRLIRPRTSRSIVNRAWFSRYLPYDSAFRLLRRETRR